MTEPIQQARLAGDIELERVRSESPGRLLRIFLADLPLFLLIAIPILSARSFSPFLYCFILPVAFIAIPVTVVILNRRRYGRIWVYSSDLCLRPGQKARISWVVEQPHRSIRRLKIGFISNSIGYKQILVTTKPSEISSGSLLWTMPESPWPKSGHETRTPQSCLILVSCNTWLSTPVRELYCIYRMPADFQPPVIDGYEPFNLSVLEKLKHSRSIDMRQGPAKIWMEPLGEGRIKIHWDIQSKEQKISQAYIQVYSIRESARGKPNFIQPNYALRLATGLFQGVAIVKIPQNLPVGYKWCLGASLVSAKGWSDKYLYEIPAEMKEEKTTPATPLS